MRRWARVTTAAAVGALSPVFGCNAIVGIQAGFLYDGSAEGGASSLDGRVSSEAHSSSDGHVQDARAQDARGQDGGREVGATDAQSHDTGHPLTDAGIDRSIPDVGVPDGCSSHSVNATDGVFVSAGQPTTSCGSETTPCGTIASGIKTAQAANKTIVYVAKGTYTEAVQLVPGITIQGGWFDLGGDWQPLCTGNPAADVMIIAPAGVYQAVTANFAADAGTGAAVMDTLTIQNLQASVPNGQSLYGVFATGSATSVTLSNVIVQTSAGGAGSGGTAGAVGTGAITCDLPGNSAAGTPGQNGQGGPAGAFSASGFTPGTAGTTGATGGSGDNGMAGKPGTTATDCGGTCMCSQPCNPICMIEHLVCTAVPGTGTVTGGEGSPGCGGLGGSGGSGGTGGASSIGVFAWGATVVVSSGTFQPGAGGAGGAGAGGGDGALGAAGAAGSSGSCEVAIGGTTCKTDTLKLGGAGGAAGGAGGNGGTGGGGTGGDSYCFYGGGGATLTVDAAARSGCTPGAVGPAGSPGGSTGVAKVQGP